MKTSISLDVEILSAIDDYRAGLRPIPKLSEAIRDLISRGLKGVNTEISKDALILESVKLRMGAKREGHGATARVYLSYPSLEKAGFENNDMLKVTIQRQ